MKNEYITFEIAIKKMRKTPYICISLESDNLTTTNTLTYFNVSYRFFRAIFGALHRSLCRTLNARLRLAFVRYFYLNDIISEVSQYFSSNPCLQCGDKIYLPHKRER